MANPPTGTLPKPIVTTPADALEALRWAHDSLFSPDTMTGHPLSAKVLLATIVIRYPRPAEWADVYQEMEPIIAAFPARVIALVHDDTEARGYGPAQVGLITRVTSDGEILARGELLLVGLDNHTYEESASLVAGWSAGGVPLISWWNGPVPAEDRLFQQIVGLADRIVVDSSVMTDCVRDFKLLQTLMDSQERAVVSDLLWLDLRSWRQVIAQMFDAPARQSGLQTLRSCVCRCVPTAAGTAAALLLVGWMGSTLGWVNPRRVGNYTWELFAGDRVVKLRVEPVSPGGHNAHPLLAEVELRSPDVAFSARRVGEDIASYSYLDESVEQLGALRAPISTTEKRWLDELNGAAVEAGVFAKAVKLASDLATK